MRILDFPRLRQTYEYDCGAKALQSVLEYFGIDLREEIILKEAKTSEKGTPVKQVLKILKKNKLKYEEGPLTIKEIKKNIRKKRPVILLVQAWTTKKNVDWKKDWLDGHYVVAIGYDRKRIYFEDPASVLSTYLSTEELEKRWHDMDKQGRKYINYGIIVYGKDREFNSKKTIHMR